ncbi:unnamed protein product [Periconia digitata]|uniref:Uncharacterized protein n=1 Tax=Periconia digitata TaxID=1303443 RepID=A0A9W4XGF6_9PLEO|nr:unnamed protein product [Periconia digitata]
MIHLQSLCIGGFFISIVRMRPLLIGIESRDRHLPLRLLTRQTLLPCRCGRPASLISLLLSQLSVLFHVRLLQIFFLFQSKTRFLFTGMSVHQKESKVRDSTAD